MGNRSRRVARKKGQDIRRVVLPTVRPVQRADAAVAHQRDADDAACAGGGDARQPWAEAVRTDVAPPLIGDPHAKCFTFGHIAHAAKSTVVSFVIS